VSKTVVDLGFPISDPPGVLRAVVVATLDLSWVSRLATEIHLQPGAAFTLVDSDGTVLLRYPQQSDWIGRPIFARPPADGLVAYDIERAVESTGADGVPRLFAFSQLKSLMGNEIIYAAIDIPAALAFAEADRILTHNLIILGVLSALTLIATWFGSDGFVLRRIGDIVSATKQVAAGKLSARTQMPYGKSELGQMARAFDDLAEALQKREAEAQMSAKQIQMRRQRENALYELNLAITSTLDLASVLRTLLEKIAELFPSGAATVSWVNKDTGALEPIAQQNLTDPEGQSAATLSERGLPLVVLKQQSPLAISNAQLDPRTSDPEFFRRHQFFFYLGLPLIAKGETLGVLSLYRHEQSAFSADDMNFLTALVNQASIAIYNSRLYEQTRNQAVELEGSNKIKDEFLGVMSHELRTPLNIIMNYAEALRMGTFGDLGAEQARGTEKIRSQASHLLTLINGILEITKIESGTIGLQMERFNLADFVSEIQSDYMLPLEKEVTLKWDTAADLPVIVSDRIKLKQILTNLVNNAIKFTERGFITVMVRALDLDTRLELKVSDTGPGIPAEALSSVFDKFRQIDSTTTRNYSGAGLGLYIVKTFVGLLQGEVDVESTIGKGSVFTVRLPIQDSDRLVPGTHGDLAEPQCL
jgi:signal transduction histidine kinase/HAMP domain-containing protein